MIVAECNPLSQDSMFWILYGTLGTFLGNSIPESANGFLMSPVNLSSSPPAQLCFLKNSATLLK